MHKLYILLITLTLSACSAPPNGGYYNSLSGNSGSYSPNSSQNRYELENMRRSFALEREALRKEVAEKDTTIAELRRDLMETRAYVNKLLEQMAKIYQNAGTQNNRGNPISYIVPIASTQNIVRQPLERISPEELLLEVQPLLPIDVSQEPIASSKEPLLQKKQQTTPSPRVIQPKTMPQSTVNKVVAPPKVATTPKNNKKNQQQQSANNNNIQENKSMPKPTAVKTTKKLATVNTKKSTAVTQQDLARNTKTYKSKNIQHKEAKALYEKALASVLRNEYSRARALFNQFLTTYKEDILYPNALYWKGETFYGAGEYANAISAFIAVPNSFPHSSKAPDALLKIIMSYKALEDKENMKRYKKTLLEQYPTSPATKKAQNIRI